MNNPIIDEASPEYAAALEELLVGFGHGDMERIHKALSALGRGPEMSRVHSRVHDILASFHSTVWKLRGDFDPAAVNMSSTNLPDAVTKLQSVLEETSKATNSLFQLLNQQEDIIQEGESYLQELEKAAHMKDLSTDAIFRFVAHYRDLNSRINTLATEMVTTQEFQDLCGQRIQKVMKLVNTVTETLTSLLQQLQISLPAKPETTDSAEKNLSQNTADEILKRLGL